jgi:hypothetical protein
MKRLEFFKKRDEFFEAKAPGFWCPNARKKAGIDHIKIEGNIDRLIPETLDH